MTDWRKPRNRRYQSLIGMLVIGIAGVAFAVVSYTLQTSNVTLTEPAADVLIGGLPIYYSWEAPPMFAVIAAIVVGMTVVVAFVGLELRDVNMSRRSQDGAHKKLSPWVLMNSTEGVFHGEVRVTALIPAHNEEKLIGATIRSLLEQDRKPDRIIVIADNCTDKTAEVARSFGVGVYETIANDKRKQAA